MNPDYMHRYGWAPMKETLQKIRDEAKKLCAKRITREDDERGNSAVSPLYFYND